MQIETHFRSAEGLRAGRRPKRTKEKDKTALPARCDPAKESSSGWPIPPSVGGLGLFVRRPAKHPTTKFGFRIQGRAATLSGGRARRATQS